MSYGNVFDPQNRTCIAGRGREGCPACIAPLHATAHTENFSVSVEELLGLPEVEKEAIGLCLLTEQAQEVGLGDKCIYPDSTFFAKFPEEPKS